LSAFTASHKATFLELYTLDIKGCNSIATISSATADTSLTMSSEALPITAARFSEALAELPISSLYAKHAELSNQIQHLESSNKQLEDFARDNDDRDCYEALMENRQVMKRFEERQELIKKEVQEVRCLPWRPMGEEQVAVAAPPATNGTNTAASNGTTAQNGEEEDGVYL